MAALTAHEIVPRGAFDEAAVNTTETDVAQTAILHASFPGEVVCDKKVVVVRRYGDRGARERTWVRVW